MQLKCHVKFPTSAFRNEYFVVLHWYLKDEAPGVNLMVAAFLKMLNLTPFNFETHSEKATFLPPLLNKIRLIPCCAGASKGALFAFLPVYSDSCCKMHWVQLP